MVCDGQSSFSVHMKTQAIYVVAFVNFGPYQAIFMRKYLLILLVFGCSLTGFTQEFHGGLMAGVAGTQVDGDSFSGYNKAGLFAGAYVNLDLGPSSSLQMELTYFQKGSRVNPDSANDFRQYLFRANYVELPVLYLHKFGKFRISAGPSAGFLVGHYEEAQYEIKHEQDDYNAPARVTLQVNIGMQFYFAKHWGVDARFNQSILNIRQGNMSGDIYRFWSYGQFHNTFVISLIYQIR